MSSPQLPPGLVADIVDLAVAHLVEEERHLESKIPLTNVFFLSASLVSHTWRDLAQPRLLKHALVMPEGVDGFLEQVKEHGQSIF